MASVSWSVAALRDLDDLDSATARRVVEKANWLTSNFVAIVPEPLHNVFSGLYKLCVGDYRIIYRLKDDAIFVEAVRHRSKAYR